MKGVALRRLPGGVNYIALHYSADPRKDLAWAAKERADTPEREWKSQMELHEDIYDGKPVYEDFKADIHLVRGLSFVPGSKLVGGMDCGMTLNPAYALTQILESGQVQAIAEVTSDGGEAMEGFAPRVNETLLEACSAAIRDIEHWADATVTQRSGTRKETAQQVAAEHDLVLRQSSNVWASRMSAVVWLLTSKLPDGSPRFVIDEAACPTLAQGFRGAYKFEESKKGDSVGPGRVLTMPLKNGYSHVHDALQYAAMRARAIVEPRQGKRFFAV